ncbi:MAG: LamG-like jellyroll fold domain-containing protein [Chthoniobacterales bacterium]
MKRYILSLIVTVGLIGSASAQTPSGELANGLISFYSFNGNTLDSTGNGNNGVATGITYSSDRYGNSTGAASFTTGSSIAIPTLDGIAFHPTTYSLWLNMKQAPENGGALTVIGRMRTWSQETGALYLVNSQAGGGTLGGNNEIVYYTGRTVAKSTYQASADNWFNLTFTYDSNQLASFYINGSLVNSVSDPATQAYPYPFLIGASSILNGVDNNSTHSWIGGIDDVGIWDTALSSNQVSKLYVAQSLPEPSTYALFGLGAIALIVAYRRRKTA